MGSMENEVERGESSLGIFAGLRAPLAFMAKIWSPDCVGTRGGRFLCARQIDNFRTVQDTYSTACEEKILKGLSKEY